MEILFMLIIMILAYSLAWWTGYLIEQGNYTSAAVIIVTVVIQLRVLFNIMEKE